MKQAVRSGLTSQIFTKVADWALKPLRNIAGNMLIKQVAISDSDLKFVIANPDMDLIAEDPHNGEVGEVIVLPDGFTPTPRKYKHPRQIAS